MFRFAAFITICCISLGYSAEQPTLFRKPAINRTLVVFSYAGDLWTVSREGGDATRLTAGAGIETDPVFSPDGTEVAFTGEYDGNRDVYTIPVTGGVPRRLTYHPSSDELIGWTPDGKGVLFCSGRNSYSFGFRRLFTMPVAGGFPAELPLPRAEEGSYSPDSKMLAYVPVLQWQRAWKRYRGGQTKPIWIVDLANSQVVDKIPRNNSNDFNPMWVGNKIYFLSDRNGPVSLFSYDTQTKEVAQLVKNDGLDLKSASAGPGAIVYEQFGSLHLFDLNSHKEHKLDIRLAGDLPEVRPRIIKLIQNGSVMRVSHQPALALFSAFEARS